MTDADKQMLEEAADYFCGAYNIDTALIRQIFFFIEKQEKEIERLQRVFKGVCIEAGERQEKLEKAEAELKTLEELVRDAKPDMPIYWRLRCRKAERELKRLEKEMELWKRRDQQCNDEFSALCQAKDRETQKAEGRQKAWEKAKVEIEHLRGIAEERYRKLASARERIRALEKGLREYGRHTNECDIGFECDPVACTCGFSALFQEIEGKEK